MNRKAGLWLDLLVKEYPVATSIIGTIIILIIIAFASYNTFILAKASVGDEDE